MPFGNHSGHSFSAVSVQKNAPALSGVYGISNAREWIFIGETHDIRAALLDHLKETGTPLRGRVPTGFTFELCGSGQRVMRRNWLIRELASVCNRRE